MRIPIGVIILLFVALIVITSTLLAFSGPVPIYILNLYGADRLPHLSEIDYFYKTMGFKLNEDVPTICLFEPVNPYVNERFWDETWIEYTVIYLNEWQYKLKAESDGKWDWNYQFYPLAMHLDKTIKHKDFKDCNVMFLFEYQSEQYHLGQTAFYYETSFSGQTVITIWATTEIQGNTTIVIGETLADSKLVTGPSKFVEIPTSTIGKIIQHEFGHALGLEHTYRTIQSGKVYSIMLPNMEPLGPNHDRYITQDDVGAVMLLYGEDGFGGWNNPQRERFVFIPWLG